MQSTSEPLFSELNRLKNVFSPLRDRLAEAGKQFHDSAVPLPENLVSDLAEFKKSVAELGNRVQELARGLSISKELPVADLDEIGRSLLIIAAAEPVIKPKPRPAESDMRASVEEAMRLANLCREQGKNSEADRIYETLLAVPRNAPGAQSPKTAETLQGFAAAKAESIRTVPAQQLSVPSGTATAVEGDINQEIDAILDNISQLAAQTSAATAPARLAAPFAAPTASMSAAMSAATTAAVATAPSTPEKASPHSSTRSQVPPEFALALHANAEPVSNRPHPLSARPMFANSVFANPEASRSSATRSMIFGGIALAGALALAVFGYMSMRQPLESSSSAPFAEQGGSVTTDATSQTTDQAQPIPAPAESATTQSPFIENTNPIAQQPTAPAQSALTPLQAAALQPAAAPPIRVTLKPVEQPQGSAKPSDSPKPLVANKDVPEPPRLVSGLNGPVVGSALGNLGNSVAPVPPPPSQEPLRVGGHLQAAKLIYVTLPDYPSQYRQAHIEGTVRLETVINKDGTVGKLTVISGNRFLNGPAIAAVKQWRYQPTLLNGEPVAVVTTVDVNFAPNQ